MSVLFSTYSISIQLIPEYLFKVRPMPDNVENGDQSHTDTEMYMPGKYAPEIFQLEIIVYLNHHKKSKYARNHKSCKQNGIPDFAMYSNTQDVVPG